MNTSANHNSALSIFLVDDDIMFLKSLEHHLLDKLKLKLNIRSFLTGESCLVSLKQKPDIIVLDYFLNGEKEQAMNGIQVLDKIKATQPDTTVIMLSGQDKMQVAIESMKHGAFDYVVKNDNVFVRAQNVIKNAIRTLHMSQELKYYKVFVWIILSVIAALGVVAFIL